MAGSLPWECLTDDGYPVIAFVPVVCGSTAGPRIREGEWLVVCRRTEPEAQDKPYCTLRVFTDPDDPERVKVRDGTYDLDLPQALEDLAYRGGLVRLTS